MDASILAALVLDVRFNQLRELIQRLLPTQVALLNGNQFRESLLDDLEISAATDRAERYRNLHLSGQVRIIELVRVSDPFVLTEFGICSREGMALARREIGKRYSVSTAHSDVNFVDCTGKAIRREPLGHGGRIGKSAVNTLGRCGQYPMQANSTF